MTLRDHQGCPKRETHVHPPGPNHPTATRCGWAGLQGSNGGTYDRHGAKWTGRSRRNRRGLRGVEKTSVSAALASCALVLIPFLRSRTVVVVGHVIRKADFEEAAESPWLRKAEHDELSHGHAVRGWDIIIDLADR
jgi:hypothetical protein